MYFGRTSFKQEKIEGKKSDNLLFKKRRELCEWWREDAGKGKYGGTAHFILGKLNKYKFLKTNTDLCAIIFTWI